MRKFGFILLLAVLLGACSGAAPEPTATPVDLPGLEPTPAVQEEITQINETDTPGGTSPSVPDEAAERFAITSQSYPSFAQITEFPVPDTPRALDFSPDSRLLAAALGNSDVFQKDRNSKTPVCHSRTH